MIYNVLLVDDEKFPLLVIGAYLKKSNKYLFNIINRSNGEEAIDIFRNRNRRKMDDNIDIIIMDLEMPKVNGADASAKIKNLIETKNFVKCKIIGYTASSEDPGIIWKETWKMDGFLRKSASE